MLSIPIKFLQVTIFTTDYPFRLSVRQETKIMPIKNQVLQITNLISLESNIEIFCRRKYPCDCC